MIVDAVFTFVLVMLIPGANGPSLIHMGDTYSTRAECRAARTEVLAEVPALIAKIPGGEAFITECEALKVEPIKQEGSR